MLDQLFGLILLGLGVKKALPPVVLGDNDTTQEASESANDDKDDNTVTITPSAGTDDDDNDEKEVKKKGSRVMSPKFTAEQQKAFQLERAKREKNIAKISESRTKELRETYLAKQKERAEKDKAAKATFEAKVKTFKDTERKSKLLALSTKYQTYVTSRLGEMQKKLEYMLTVLDRVTASAGALKAQGKDVSETESLVSSAQAKVTSATSLVAALTETVSTTLTLSSEESAKDDVVKAIESLKQQMEPVRTAFAEAYQAVKKALESVEEITDAEEVAK